VGRIFMIRAPSLRATPPSPLTDDRYGWFGMSSWFRHPRRHERLSDGFVEPHMCSHRHCMSARQTVLWSRQYRRCACSGRATALTIRRYEQPFRTASATRYPYVTATHLLHEDLGWDGLLTELGAFAAYFLGSVCVWLAMGGRDGDDCAEPRRRFPLWSGDSRACRSP
jgi:hypothetical protein